MAEDQVEIEGKQKKTIGNTLRSEDKVTDLDVLLDVDVQITAVLGTTMMPIGQVLQLGRGAVVMLARAADQDIEIFANNRLIATGEVVMIDRTNDGLTRDDPVGVKINNVLRLPKSLTS